MNVYVCDINKSAREEKGSSCHRTEVCPNTVLGSGTHISQMIIERTPVNDTQINDAPCSTASFTQAIHGQKCTMTCEFSLLDCTLWQP